MKGKQLVIGVLLAATLSVFFVFRAGRVKPMSSQELSRLGEFPAFSMTDQSGREVTPNDLIGKIWIADFLDASALNSEATRSSRFAELDRNFAKAGDLRLISFSEGMELSQRQTYARRYEAGPQWLFLSADASATANLRDTLASRLKLTSSVMMTSFVLVDWKGAIRRVYDGDADESVPEILTDVGALLRSDPR